MTYRKSFRPKFGAKWGARRQRGMGGENGKAGKFEFQKSGKK